MGAVVVAVSGDLVPGGRHVCGDAAMDVGVHAQHEERGVHVEPGEFVEEVRRRGRVRAVVEGERHVIR